MQVLVLLLFFFSLAKHRHNIHNVEVKLTLSMQSATATYRQVEDVLLTFVTTIHLIYITWRDAAVNAALWEGADCGCQYQWSGTNGNSDHRRKIYAYLFNTKSSVVSAPIFSAPYEFYTFP